VICRCGLPGSIRQRSSAYAIPYNLWPLSLLYMQCDVRDREIRTVMDLSPADVVRGFVKAMEPSGCFVYLGQKVFFACGCCPTLLRS
jgi:hypothetical protein